MNNPDPGRSKTRLPSDDSPPVFDRGRDKLPSPDGASLPMDDEMNILPGNDTLDDDPNDNGDREQNDPADRRLGGR